MVTIGMNYEVISGKEAVFERAFAQVLKVMEEGTGHRSSHLYQKVGESASYLIVSEWDDASAFDSFIRSEAFAKVTQWGKEQVLSARPRHTVYHHEN